MNDPISAAAELRGKDTRTIVGLMSGTSADGVTAAVTEVSGKGVTARIRLIGYETYPYPDEVRENVFTLFNPELSTVAMVSEMNSLIGHVFADAVKRIIDHCGAEPDLVGSHGQTVWHQPTPASTSGYTYRSTLQIGDPTVISAVTGLPVVADFRSADVAAGGEGAPLTPYLDYVLHRSSDVTRVLQNIGGIANLTYIPAGGSLDRLIAYDTGPGNMIIDVVTEHYRGQSYDEDGRMASSGAVNPVLLDHLLSHPYYRLDPPKTTGREMFGEQYASQIIRKAEAQGLTPPDVAATVSTLTVESIARSIERLPGPVDEVYLSGGGARNPYLVDGLSSRLKAEVLDYGCLGYPGEAKESLLVALLANEHVMGEPGNVPSATGAGRRVVLGHLVFV